jgi:hypothetical protein
VLLGMSLAAVMYHYIVSLYSQEVDLDLPCHMLTQPFWLGLMFGQSCKGDSLLGRCVHLDAPAAWARAACCKLFA